MKLTKFEHACLVLENSDEVLIVDPGAFSPLRDVPEGVVGVVITHEHSDHWTPEHLNHILKSNPDARLFGTAATVASAALAGVHTTIEQVNPGDQVSVGSFRLAFFGGLHAIIHSSIAQIDNVGVLVNETLYYPGDSFFVPNIEVDVLAAPASAPWMKMGEALDFILAVQPKRVLQTHEMINSDIGNEITRDRMNWASQEVGADFSWVEVGESLTL
jgi:L-ascorbate metabolism protein UlaG (beta-lactamase superfamily)